MNITITTPTLADVDTMFVWGTTHRELWTGEKDGWYTKDMLIEWWKNSKETMLVAKEGTKLVGMCLFDLLHGWGYCGDLYVDDAYRGRGIGKMLLQRAQEYSYQKGIDVLELVVAEGNREAKKFYKKVGFREGFHFTWMSRKGKKRIT